MQLPQYKKKKRIKLKVCQFPGCGKEFWGHPISKYCEEHNDIKLRLKNKKEQEEIANKLLENQVDENNQEYKHNYPEVTEMEFPCALEGCNNKFTIKIFPKQYIYPKYCEEHRNKHRREMFTKLINQKKKKQK